MEAHMVKQTITYSDGTETVINYRGVITNGVLVEDQPEAPKKKSAAKTVKEAVKKVVKKITK